MNEELDQALKDALAEVVHVGDYGDLWVNEEQRLVHLTMGDADGDPDNRDLTDFGDIRRMVTEAMQPFWPGWSAGESNYGGLDGQMQIADEWVPVEDDGDDGWHEIGRIGRELGDGAG